MLQEFEQALKDRMDTAIRGIHTAFPGTVIAYDPEKGMATVQPAMKYRTPGGQTMDYPHLYGVPVLFQQGAGQQATVAFPVKPGDGCLVIVAEQSLDWWLYGQETPTSLTFDLTDAVCIPGLFATANAAARKACEEEAVVADVHGTCLTLKEGLIQMDAARIQINGNTFVNGDFTTSGGTVHLN